MEPTRAPFRSWGCRLCAASDRSVAATSVRLALVVVSGLMAGACGEGTSSNTTTSASPTPSSALTQVYVALGDAFTAGMVSNALVESHQAYSFPAQIARQGGTADFQQPLVSTPGIDVELELRRFYQGPIQIAPRATTPGHALNASLTSPYNNLGVPGAKLADLLSTSGTTVGFHSLVLRSFGTALTQANRLRPSLVTLWIGNSDILSAVIAARAVDGVTLTPASQFETNIAAAIKSLTTGTSATIFVANIPDFTRAPFASSIKPYVVDATTGEPKLKDGQRIALIGPQSTPLPSSALVTLAASELLANGDGIPVSAGGNGKSLPDEVVLNQDEVDKIRARIDSANRAIVKAAGDAGIDVVDLHALFEELASTGRTVGGLKVDSTFLTGGVFGYDGVHLTDLGYALVANEWITVINDNGGAIPLIDLSPIMGIASGPGVTSGPAPTPPFRFSAEAMAGLQATYGTGAQ